METTDNMRTKNLAKKNFEKSEKQLRFEQLLKKVHETQGLSRFCDWYMKQADAPEGISGKYAGHKRKISDRIRKQLARGQVSDIEKHLKFLEQYCKSKNIDCGFVGMPDFMIDSLHDDPEIAREIFNALSSLDWSNEGDGS